MVKILLEKPGDTPLQEILNEAEKFAAKGKTVEIEHSEGKIRIVEAENTGAKP